MLGQHRNVGEVERLATTILGAWIALRGLGRRPLRAILGVGFGGALVARGLSGWCPLYGRLGLSTKARPVTRRFTRHLSVALAPDETWWRCRRSVEALLASRDPVRIIDEAPPRYFRWRCGKRTGDVTVTPDAAAPGSILKVSVDFGRAGRGGAAAWLDSVQGRIWQHAYGEHLRQFKSWLETGDGAREAVGDDQGRSRLARQGLRLAESLRRRSSDMNARLGIPRRAPSERAGAPEPALT